MKALTSSTAKHVFAIQILDKLPGLFKPHRYLYYCARCKWSFVINDGRSGAITALDADGNRLPGDEARRRLATFAVGPCPSLQVLNFERRPLQTSNDTEASQHGRIVIDHTEPRATRYFPRRSSTR